MDLKVKILAAVVPFLIAGAVGGAMAWPAYEEYNTKSSTLEQKKEEEAGLSQKLAGRAKVLSDKKLTEEALEKLRSSIPKKPELEILNIDLERMCKDSGIDLVSFSEAGMEQLKAAGMEDEVNKMQTSAQKLKDKIKGNAKTATAASATAGGGTAGKKPDKDAPPDTGLSKVILNVKCIGDYPGLMALVHRMETYQRVIGITNIKSTVPKKVTVDKNKKTELPDIDATVSETDEQGDFHRLNISFLLTAYYLP